MGPKHDSCPCKKRKVPYEDRDTQEEDHVATEAEIRVVYLQSPGAPTINSCYQKQGRDSERERSPEILVLNF